MSKSRRRQPTRKQKAERESQEKRLEDRFQREEPSLRKEDASKLRRAYKKALREVI